LVLPVKPERNQQAQDGPCKKQRLFLHSLRYRFT
jgi:hypothetical protein